MISLYEILDNPNDWILVYKILQIFYQNDHVFVFFLTDEFKGSNIRLRHFMSNSLWIPRSFGLNN